MTGAEILARARGVGIVIWLDGGRVGLRGPADLLPAIKQQIVEKKNDVIAALAAEAADYILADLAELDHLIGEMCDRFGLSGSAREELHARRRSMASCRVREELEALRRVLASDRQKEPA